MGTDIFEKVYVKCQDAKSQAMHTFYKRILIYINGCFVMVFNDMSEVDPLERTVLQLQYVKQSKIIVDFINNDLQSSINDD